MIVPVTLEYPTTDFFPFSKGTIKPCLCFQSFKNLSSDVLATFHFQKKTGICTQKFFSCSIFTLLHFTWSFTMPVLHGRAHPFYFSKNSRQATVKWEGVYHGGAGFLPSMKFWWFNSVHASLCRWYQQGSRLMARLLDSQINSLATQGLFPFHPAVRSSCLSVFHSRIPTVIIYFFLSFKILSSP